MKSDPSVRVEIIRKLECFEPSTLVPNSGAVVKFGGREEGYFKLPSQLAAADAFYHYPIIVDPNGVPWVEANRYLLSRLNAIVPAKHRTLESIAGDLAHFRRWLLDEDIDLLVISPRPRARPTYRYCAHLHDDIRLGNLKAGTAKRRMSSVQNFYRWLEMDGYKFEFPLWIENGASLLFKDSRGFQQRKAVKSTDLTRSFRIVKSGTDYTEYIDDGGKLRPLPKDEQVALIDGLKAIGNTEMTLAFYLALTTGARLQTVFTLRRKNFLDEPYEGAVSHRIKVGSGTPVSTKYGRQMVLLIPLFLYRRVQVYIRSQRSKKRIAASKHVYSDAADQYLFLTRVGQPYYMADHDPFAFLYRNPPRGNAVTQFIRQQLKPELLSREQDFEFRFHDLRATFGMNLLESFIRQMSRSELNALVKPDLTKAMMLVRTRMGHSSIRTTEAYLNYREKYHVAVALQTEYEAYLESMLTEEEIDDLG